MSEIGSGYRMVVAYDGTAYHGWQAQSGVRTVEGALILALAAATGERVRVRAAGRTDAGVHAHGQVVAFVLSRDWSPPQLLAACNSHLPEDIAVLEADRAELDFDPRRRAWRRTYRYLLAPTRVPSPIGRQYAWRVSPQLEIEPMREAARLVVGRHDFAAFGRSSEAGASTVRTVEMAAVESRVGLIAVEVRGDAFLRGMLRNLVGALVAVGEGRLALADFAAAVAGGHRGAGSWRLAPAHGLHQWRVDYERPLTRGAKV